MTPIEYAILEYNLSGPWKKEDYFQISTAKLLDVLADDGRLDWFHASPNVYRRALRRNRGAAMRAGALGKKMGVKAGIFDCIIYSHKIAIELKQTNGSLSDDQKKFRVKAEGWGWICLVTKKPGPVIELLFDEGIIEVKEILEHE